MNSFLVYENMCRIKIHILFQMVEVKVNLHSILSKIHKPSAIMSSISVSDELSACFVLFCSSGWTHTEFITGLSKRGLFFTGCSISKDERLTFKRKREKNNLLRGLSEITWLKNLLEWIVSVLIYLFNWSAELIH